MVQVSLLLLHLLWKDKTDNTRYSLAEEGSGLEGQLQCWSATQVISGSGTQGKLKTQPHFPARLGKDKQIKCCSKFTEKKITLPLHATKPNKQFLPTHDTCLISLYSTWWNSF